MSRTLTSIVVVLICVLSAASAYAADVTVTIAGADKVTLTLPAPKTPDEKPSVTWSQTYYVYVDNTTNAVVVEEPIVQKLQDAAGNQIAWITKVVVPDVGTKATPGEPLAYTIAISATLAKAGEYTTNIRATAAGKVGTKTITVVVAAAAPPAVAATPAPVEALIQVDKGAKAYEGDDQLRGDEAETVVLTVRNKSKSAVAISATGMVMTRKTAATHSVDVAASVNDLSVEGQAEDTIPAETTARVRVTLAGLDTPGEYNGLLRLTPTDKSVAPIDLEIAVFLRHTWLLCALLIVIGAVVAYLVRHFQDIGRTKQSRRIEVAAIGERLRDLTASAATRQAVDLARELHRQVRDLDERIARGGKIDDAKNPITHLGTRVDRYGRYAEIDAVVARLPQATRDEKRKLLDPIAIALSNPAADLAKISTDLNAIGLEEAQRGWLQGWLAALRRDVDTHSATADAEMTNAIGATIVPAMARAEDAMKSGEFAAVETALDQAQRALVQQGIRSLRKALDTAPAGIDAAAWKSRADEMRMRIDRLQPDGDVNSLITEYGEIYATYIAAVAQGAVVRASSYMEKTGAPPAFVAEVKVLRDALSTVAAAKPLDTSAVVTAIAALRSKLAEVGMAIASKAGDIDPQGISAKPERDVGFAVFARATRGPSSQELLTRLRTTEAVVFVVVTLLGTLAGLKLLWVSNATWGGPVDVLTALVWGAGVNVSKDGFMGLLKLRNDLGKV